MKKIKLILSGLMLLLSATGAFADSTVGIRCIINRSESIILYPNRERVTLYTAFKRNEEKITVHTYGYGDTCTGCDYFSGNLNGKSYVGEISENKAGALTLKLSIDGGKKASYACTRF